MWLEYAKLEILYITKIAARRKILGIDGNGIKEAVGESSGDPDADVLMLPKVTKEDINPTLRDHNDIDQVALRTLDSTSAMNGAIPIAIFDAGMAQFQNDSAFGKACFDVCSEFENVPFLRKIMNHVVEAMIRVNPDTWQAQACFIRVAVGGLDVSSPDFPPNLSVSLSRLKSALSRTQEKVDLAEDILSWVRALLDKNDLDPAIRQVLAAKKHSLEQLVSPEKPLEGIISL
jgi:U3 small nucleolar RNA-associated protein 6